MRRSVLLVVLVPLGAQLVDDVLHADRALDALVVDEAHTRHGAGGQDLRDFTLHVGCGVLQHPLIGALRGLASEEIRLPLTPLGERKRELLQATLKEFGLL